MSYLLMEELVGRHPDGIQEAVSLQVFINLWFGEGRIATKVFSDILASVPLNNRFQKFFPSVSAMDIAGAEQDTLTITPLVEAKQRMETATPEMTVIGGPFLFAMYRALRTVQVQNDSSMRCLVHCFLNPLAIDL
tara:strand:+ start:184 stop:588 length:405 start_codon:yes stop_codon:yes gene_type:complete